LKGDSLEGGQKGAYFPGNFGAPEGVLVTGVFWGGEKVPLTEEGAYFPVRGLHSVTGRHPSG